MMGYQRIREWRTWKSAVTVGVSVLAQQVIASLAYATQQYLEMVHPHEIVWTEFPNWHFWFFWNDYWIFLKYLSWPGTTGDHRALVANVVGVLLVVGAVVAFALTEEVRDS